MWWRILSNPIKFWHTPCSLHVALLMFLVLWFWFHDLVTHHGHGVLIAAVVSMSLLSLFVWLIMITHSSNTHLCEHDINISDDIMIIGPPMLILPVTRLLGAVKTCVCVREIRLWLTVSVLWWVIGCWCFDLLQTTAVGYSWMSAACFCPISISM